MRTTIYLPDDLLLQAKKTAAESRTSVTALIEDALKARLNRRRESISPEQVRLSTYGEKGLQPGVDLDDGAALLDLMERGDDSR